MDDKNKPEQDQKMYKKGYGKRPLWQWIVIYVVFAIIVYGLIYYIFFHHTSSTGSSGY